MVSNTRTSQQALTAAQRRVFDNLLGIGSARPVAPIGLADELTSIIVEGTSAAVSQWSESKLWVSKSLVSSMLRCEGSVVASAALDKSSVLSPAIALGVVSHRAIQVSHTHPHLTPAAAVESALEASMDDARFAEFWNTVSPAVQSDLVCQMVSRTVGFLDAFPPLAPNWVPRFEESIQARVGNLVLSSRPDLVLGRPRPDMRQSMFICDFKTGSLNDSHELEGMFYALVATLRFGVPPYRSTVFSLASGEWTSPDVTADRLLDTAKMVAETISRYVDIMIDRREPLLQPDRWCSWCPAQESCTAAGSATETPRSPSADASEAAAAVSTSVEVPSRTSVFDIV